MPTENTKVRRGWTAIQILCISFAIPALACTTSRLANGANGIASVTPMVVSRAGVSAPGYSKQSGLQLTVDSTWAGTRGYRPIRVIVTTPKPVTADKQLTIEFRARTWQLGEAATTVEHDFELSQGMSTTTTEFLVPQLFDWSVCSWDLWVDGVQDEENCVENSGFNLGNNSGIAVGVEATRNAALLRSSRLAQAVAGGAVDEMRFNISDLPDSWLSYSALDVFLARMDLLEHLRVSNPQKLTALKRWIRTGGTLWVLDVGQDFSKLARLEALLSPELSETANAAADLDHWKFLPLSQKGRSRVNDAKRLTMQVPVDELTQWQIAESKDPNRAQDSRNWYVVQAFGHGRIVAIQSDPENGNVATIDQLNTIGAALQRSSIADNLRWISRHGNDSALGNPNFHHLLIPDVGAAPVFEFQMLITLFAIAIGPVNYWILRRRNQLPLLLLTVPAAALGTTLLLFAYGFLADGFGVRVRARSLTNLDQRSGEVATWARLSYYAGIAPSDGLNMPRDTAVYPISSVQSDVSGFGSRVVAPQKSLHWDKNQHLTRGWLASRTPTQYLTLSARSTEKRLQFEETAAGMQVKNLLGTDVLLLIVEDRHGNVFAGSELAAGETADLTVSNFLDTSAQLRRVLGENTPQTPPGYVGRQGRGRYRNMGASMAESFMEAQLEALNAPDAQGWGNSTYLAVTEQGIETSLGLENVRETASFHLLRGTW